MSAPTTAITNSTGTIPNTTGEANGLLLAADTLLSNPRVRLGFSGTFTSCVVAVRGRLNGLTQFYPVRAVNPNGSALIADSTNISLTDSTNQAVEVDASGCDQLEVWLVSGTGPIAVEVRQTASASGPITNVLNTTVSGTQTYTGASTVNVSSATAFVVGPNGTTNPTLQVVTNVASEATGLKVTGAAAAGGLALAVISSGTDEALSLNAKGAGAITIGTVSTGAVTIGAASQALIVPGPLTRGVGGSTAAAGSTTADAGALPAGTAGVYPTTGADDTKGVVISTSDKVTGRTLFIGNGVSNKILKVYPPSGGTINGAAGDAAFSSASGKGVIITCLSSGSNTWLAC